MKEIYLKCVGCNSEYLLNGLHPIYGCPNKADDNINHILDKNLPENYQAPKESETLTQSTYSRFKDYFFSYHLSTELNVDFEAILKNFDKGLINIGEPGFIETPVVALENSDIINGKLIIKDETNNVTGSHKARHLMGNILYIEVLVRAGILKTKPRLAVYSCGNAGLGAAAVAKAANYDLDVFIPPNLNKSVTDKLEKYRANIVTCRRMENESGDPCYNRFQEALAEGSVPFSCSGPDNWPNIEGGQTLCLELMSQLNTEKIIPDSIVIQVGGGALASSAIKTLEELLQNHSIDQLPTVYAVQTEGGFPLVRAYYLLIRQIALANGFKCSFKFQKQNDSISSDSENNKVLDYFRHNQNEIKEITSFIKENYSSPMVQNLLTKSVNNMNSVMWSWEVEPHSIAHGILDDITYDWYKIIQGLFKSGGIPVVVNEPRLIDANEIAHRLTDINVDPTGSSGLAGLMELISLGYINKSDNSVVFFTGVVR